jgi:oligopeptide transport system ATP-binding protein
VSEPREHGATAASSLSKPAAATPAAATPAPAAPTLEKPTPSGARGAMGETLLEVRGLQKHFPLTQGIVFKRTIGHVRAVDGVDLTLRRGETVGLVGESGCGKSTVSKLIVALERPTAGSILYKGKDVTRMGRRALKAYRREVQIIFQDPYASLNPRMTVGDIVAEGWAVHADVAPKKGRLKRTQELLDRVGLNPDYVNRYPHQFSGGQRQRIGIARALALQPEVIVCDEPVSALDVSVQAQVVNLLEDLQDEFGLSYLFIAHDLSVVRHISDRVAVMYLGSIVEEGTDEQVYTSPSHPYTQALLSSVPLHEPHLRGQKDRILLTGDVPSPADPPSGCRFRTRCWKAQDVCATEAPALVDRGQGHPSACHFAEARMVVPVDAE